MAISDTQKVDWLWKKVGYGAAKTDNSTAKSAINEGITSPLLLRGDKVWVDADQIPKAKPDMSDDIVQIYDDSGRGNITVQAVEEATSTKSRTWKTNLTDWIPPEFGSTYLVKVYVDSFGTPNPQTTGTQLFPTEGASNSEWFFDYQAGILNFIGDNLPDIVEGKSIYISGARYVGEVGVTKSKIYYRDTEVEVTPFDEVLINVNGNNKVTINSDGLVTTGNLVVGTEVVAGMVESTTEGFKFPDGSTQTKSAGHGLSAMIALGLA